MSWSRPLRGEGAVVYAALATCPCGAGLAYAAQEEMGNAARGWWCCSRVLLGEIEENLEAHTTHLAFSESSVTSELRHDMARRGVTTRPRREP